MRFLEFKNLVNYKSLYWTYIILIGLVFIFLVPPFQKADENTHYLNTASILQGNLFCNKSNIYQKKFLDFEKEMKVSNFAFNYLSKFPISLIKENLYKNFTDNTLEKNSFCISPFGYITIIPGMLLFANNLLLGFYFARLLGFLFFLTCLFWSFKILDKKYHFILYIYSLLPMLLHQVTAINYDVVQMSLIMPIFSYLIFFILNKKISCKKIILFIFLILWFQLVKPSYYFLIFIWFLIPYKNIVSSRKKYFLFSSLILLIDLVLNFGLYRIFYSESLSSNNYVDLGFQLKLIENDPIYFLNVLKNTIISAEGYLKPILGYFGWLDYGMTFLNYIWIIILVTVIMVFGFRLNKKPILNWIQLFILFCIVFGNAILIITGFYLTYSSVGSKIAIGVQGRYFLVLIPFFIFALTQLFLLLKQKGWHKIVLEGFLFIVIISGLIKSIYLRYYDYSLLFSNKGDLSEIYEKSVKEKKDFNKVVLNQKMTYIIDLNTENKIGGFQLLVDNDDKKIFIPYRYEILDEKCKQKIYGGYFDQAVIQQNKKIYQEEFKKVVELKGSKVCFEIEPVLIKENENYLNTYKVNDKLMLNLLYIQR